MMRSNTAAGEFQSITRNSRKPRLNQETKLVLEVGIDPFLLRMVRQ